MRHASNRDIAAILNEIADFLEADNVAFKPQAYRRAAKYIEELPQPLTKVYREGGVKALDALPDIGANIAQKLAELIDTGQLKYLTKLRAKLPVRMRELTAIEGMGPKTVKVLYQKLKIKTRADLVKAARAHRIRHLPGFQARTEENILAGISLLKKSSGRWPLAKVQPLTDRIITRLRRLPAVSKIAAAGSVRRKEKTVGDIDIVAASNRPASVIEKFCSLPEVMHVYSRGDTKALVRLQQGIDADLRVVPPASYGAALQYFTGNKAHSIATRRLARSQGMKLNEYGLYRGKKRIAGPDERGIYKALGLPYLPPQRRSDAKI